MEVDEKKKSLPFSFPDGIFLMISFTLLLLLLLLSFYALTQLFSNYFLILIIIL